MIASTVSREALLHVVKNLPAAPRILAQLGHLLLDPNSDLSDVINLLKRDTGLTARVIRVSNSAIYGAGSRAGCLEEALLRVGFNEVYRLVGLAAVAQISDDALKNYGISGTRFRENSLFAAFMMEVLAASMNLDSRSAYTAGLLRSTGKIGVDRLVPSFSRNYNTLGKGRPIDEWELEVVGTDNCAAAAVILDEWRFPAATSSGIRDHYRPGETAAPMAILLNIACSAAERAGYALPGEQTYWDMPTERYLAVNVDEEVFERAMMMATERFEPARQAIS